MLVAALSEQVRVLRDRHPAVAAACDRLLGILKLYDATGDEEFVGFVATMKKPPKPKKTPADVAREKAAKAAEAKRQAELKKAETQRIAAEKAAQNRADAAAKAEAKRQADLAKKAKAAADLLIASPAVTAVIGDLKALLARFRGGNVPEHAVAGQLRKLDPLTGLQLYQVAQGLNADAGLTPKTAKQKIKKQLTEMVNRVWKTSDNVNH